MEALVDGTAAARRTVWHQTGGGRQQGGQADGDPGGAQDGGPGLARHRLRPRGAADRPGDPGALPLPGRGDAGAVHGPGPGDHPHGVPPRPAQRRARPALRGGGGARRQARPDLQPVADPDGDRNAGSGRRGRDRHRPGQDADPGDRVPARDRDPRLRAGRVSRGGGHGACRGRDVPDAARPAGADRRTRKGAGGPRGGAGLRGSARGAGRGQAAAPAPAARPALSAEAVQHALRLAGYEDAGRRPGTL